MIVEDLTTCPKCGYEKALTHYSTDSMINWVACSKCKTFFDHNIKVEEKDEEFWKQVEEDTSYERKGCE